LSDPLPDRTEVIEQIEVEFELMEQFFETYAVLFQRAVEDEKINVIEATALASVLHSFYNGLENIFVVIGKRFDFRMPTGEQWHRSLLLQMSTPTPLRSPVLTEETVAQLIDYLSFRHFYRHSYSHLINWNKLKQLVLPMPALWLQVKRELQHFIQSLQENQD
jgi:hypothetical protein